MLFWVSLLSLKECWFLPFPYSSRLTREWSNYNFGAFGAAQLPTLRLFPMIAPCSSYLGILKVFVASDRSTSSMMIIIFVSSSLPKTCWFYSSPYLIDVGALKRPRESSIQLLCFSIMEIPCSISLKIAHNFALLDWLHTIDDWYHTVSSLIHRFMLQFCTISTIPW